MTRAGRAVFLDRDGTLNVDSGYVHHREQWQWLPGAIEGIRSLNQLGLPVVVVTNQSGVGRGYYTVQDVHELHRWIDVQLRAWGVRIDGYYLCPHAPVPAGPGCGCRKPAPGLLRTAAVDLELDLSRCFVIGDKQCDIDVGRAVGARALHVGTGALQSTASSDLPSFTNLPAAVAFIASRLGRRG